MTQYVCSKCGEPCFFDGRCGDGPILMCQHRNDGGLYPDRGGYVTIGTGTPITLEEYNRRRPKQDYDSWDLTDLDRMIERRQHQ